MILVPTPTLSQLKYFRTKNSAPGLKETNCQQSTPSTLICDFYIFKYAFIENLNVVELKASLDSLFGLDKGL